MDDSVTLTGDDAGKDVVDAEGDQVGRIVEVETGNARVDPDPGLTDAIRSELGWGDGDGESDELDAADIERVSDNGVHLSG